MTIENCLLAGLRMSPFSVLPPASATSTCRSHAAPVWRDTIGSTWVFACRQPCRIRTAERPLWPSMFRSTIIQASNRWWNRHNRKTDASAPCRGKQTRFLRRFFHWRGEYNAYALRPRFPLPSVHGRAAWTPATIKQLDEWRQFSGSAERECIQGSVKFQGGDLLARAANAPEQLTPEDFRLRPDSAGYRAGPDGKDLGADIDLVGPGPAYERWKKTPAYQEWLKDAGQSAAEVLDDDARAKKRLSAGGRCPKDGRGPVRRRSGPHAARSARGGSLVRSRTRRVTPSRSPIPRTSCGNRPASTRRLPPLATRSASIRISPWPTSTSARPSWPGKTGRRHRRLPRSYQARARPSREPPRARPRPSGQGFV